MDFVACSCVCMHASSAHVLTAHVSVCAPAYAMRVSPPPHPAPLRDEQMDTVGGESSEAQWNKRKDFFISSPSSYETPRPATDVSD